MPSATIVLTTARKLRLEIAVVGTVTARWSKA